MAGTNRVRQQERKSRKSKKTVAEKHMENRIEEQKDKPIIAKTENQKKALASFEENIISLLSGDAGSGKSYLASRWAAKELRLGHIDKIVIARPYVTMGKSVGLFPGDVRSKLGVFLLPLLNNIQAQLGRSYEYYLNSGEVEIHPLEAIRGMSFENCILIIDEFQNTTPEEVKSIVTRIGENCKLLLTGDKKQSDIRGKSGIVYLQEIVEKYDIKDVGIVTFTHDDIVRSGIVKEFVIAFDKEGDHGKKG
jgi:phosphate starvation-inducible PhoH-like protein